MWRFSIFVFFFSFIAVAAIKPDHIRSIQLTCQQSPTECLKRVTPVINSLTDDSRTKFSLLLLKMDALYALEQGKAVLNEVKPWLDKQEIPQYFKLRCYIYYAKEIAALKQMDEAKLYLHKAIDLLKQSNEVYPDPILLLDITNLQLYFNEELDDAFETLKWLEQKYQKRYNPVFKRELYSNLGHIAYQLELFDQQINYRIAALKWSKEVGNQQQISVAQFNLARAYDVVQRYSLAERHYFQAVHFANLAHDQVLLIAARMYLTQLKLNINQLTQARLIFNDIDATSLPEHRIAMYNQLKQALKATQ